MKRIHPEDPRVTAHALGELPKHEGAEVDRAALSNQAVQAAVEETRTLAELLQQGFAAEQLELGEERREAIRRAGRRPAAENLVSMRASRRWARAAGISAAAAALVAGGVWILTRTPAADNGRLAGESGSQAPNPLRAGMLLGAAPRPGRADRGPGSRRVPAAPEFRSPDHEREFGSLQELKKESPGAYDAEVQEAARSADMKLIGELPELKDNAFVLCREEGRTSVPVAAGSGSVALVRRFLRTDRVLPPARVVRTEEFINQVVYLDEGDADLDGVRLGVELMRCPWSEGDILMGILLRNESDRMIAPDAILEIEMKPEHVRSYRLLGYADPGPEASGRPSLTRGLAPGKSNFVLYQLRPMHTEVLEKTRVLARVALQLAPDDQRGLIVPVSGPPDDWGIASNNMQTAASLGGFAMLLRKSPFKGDLSPAVLESLARDALQGAESGDLPRREALGMIFEAMPLFPGGGKGGTP